jgi:enoyl-CoA hydratase
MAILSLDEYHPFEHGGGVFDEPKPGILRLTLNRPERWNAVPIAMHDALPALFSRIGDDAGVKAFVLRARGDAFSSGGDVDEGMRTRHAGEVVALHHIAVRIITRLLEIPQLTMCLVNGPAIGFAANLALHFDFIVATDSAYFADPHVAFGTVPGDGAASIWPLLLGPARAKEFLFTGAKLSAQQALAAGMVNRVVARDSLDEAGDELLESALAMAPLAIRLGKMVLNTPLRAQAEQSLNLSMSAEMATLLSEDYRRAVDGFMRHRQFAQDWIGQ